MSTGARLCAICSHPDRDAIEQAVVNGKSHRAISRDFGLGPASASPWQKVARHVKQCMGESFRAAREAVQVASGEALVERMRHLDAVVDEVIARARKGEEVRDENGPMLDAEGRPIVKHRDPVLLAAVREARRNTELRARLAGALEEGDELAVAEARRALESPDARKLVSQLEATMAEELAKGKK